MEKCEECGWEGESEDMCWAYYTHNGSEVEYSLCPECGSDDVEEI